MTPTAMFIAALILLSAGGLATWAWFAMARVARELRFFSGFEGMHLESGTHTAENSEGARWPTPG
jgi:hypothetical protein